MDPVFLLGAAWIAACLAVSVLATMYVLFKLWDWRGEEEWQTESMFAGRILGQEWETAPRQPMTITR